MLSVVYIFWLRQVKRYLRNKPRIIGSVGQPLMFLIALGFGLNPIFEKAMQVSYIQFLVPGVIGLTLLFTAMFSGIELIWDRRFGFLKETLVAPIPRFSIMLGKTLGGATVAVLQGILVFLLSFIFGFHLVNPWLIPLWLVGAYLISILFTALGLAIATQLDDTSSFPLIINFVMFPLFFLSGALFPLDNLPSGLDLATKLNPLTYGIDAMRYSLIGEAHNSMFLDFGVLILVSLLIISIGSYLFSKIRI